MPLETIVKAGEDPSKYTVEQVGGKGLNLLKLYQMSKKTGSFSVPYFFIIPTEMKRYHQAYGMEADKLGFPSDEVRTAFEALKKPVIIRSSSPLEDGTKATFAGMFASFHDRNTYDQLMTAAEYVQESARDEFVHRHARRMGVRESDAMAFIVQEQVTDFMEKGIIQLEARKAVIEGKSQGANSRSELEYGNLALLAGGKRWMPCLQAHDYIGEGEYYYAIQCAQDAKEQLGLEGTVQVEFLLAPAKLPAFVQIRQLPEVRSLASELDLDVPKDTPYLESDICNGIAGELSLPAYVTCSQANFSGILVAAGQAEFDKADDRRAIFLKRSNLAANEDFIKFYTFWTLLKIKALSSTEYINRFEKRWERGNSLFENYILVCDKLDENAAGMNRLTTNKKAIITCLEAKSASHTMTVARELGIMAMGVEGDLMDMSHFYNRVETGDVVHMKSDGKRAVAYIERKREADPYLVRQ